MRHLLSLLCCAAAALGPLPSAAQSPAQSPADGLLVLVDHDATSAEAAQRCEQHQPGSGAAIRAAHARWREQHHAAQAQMLERMNQDIETRRAARGERTLSAQEQTQALTMFHAASLDKLRKSMGAMDAAALTQFCNAYPQEFDKPAMDFTAQWLRMRSRR
jgi:hypothetical protein